MQKVYAPQVGRVGSTRGYSALRLSTISRPAEELLSLVCATIGCQGWDDRLDLTEFRFSKLTESNSKERAQGVIRIGELRSTVEENTAESWARVASLCRRSLRRPDWALHACNESLEINPRNAAAICARIAANGELGNLEDAERDYLRIETIKPGYTYAQYAIASARLRNGKEKEAIQPATAAYRVCPTKPGALLLAKIAKANNEHNQARGWLRDANESQLTRGSGWQ